MTLPLSPERLAEGLETLIEQAETLSADYSDVVQDAVRAAKDEPLDDHEARELFVRILTILRTTGRDLDAGVSDRLAGQIRTEAAELVASRRARSATPATSKSAEIAVRGGLTFHSRFGLTPRAVLPVPSFNGQPLMLTEGYVDVTTLPLWMDNHRVQLHVTEFREINHRDPEPQELLDLMHGSLPLPSLDDKDPFKLKGLAASIARKGVERAPICTWEGEPKDGNRRIAASRMVLEDPAATPEQKDRARWIRVWQAPEGTTEDQFEAIVVALNFEPDHKEDWPEYVKARLVVDRYRTLLEDVRVGLTEKRKLELRKQVADQFAITHTEVKRYLEMLLWADDFEDYHTTDREQDPAAVRYKANDIFQWFYEVQAGRGQDKIVAKVLQDEALRAVVYDLMYDVLDSGLQVRNLHKVVADEAALDLLKRAHEEPNRDQALKFVDAAIAEAAKNSPTKKLGFEQFLRSTVDRLGSAPPDQWRNVDGALLADLRRVFHGALGAIEGELAVRGGTGS
ncbi:MAG: hypothetical protein ACYCWW_08295 [Deltaproteobacteria bacterium]